MKTLMIMLMLLSASPGVSWGVATKHCEKYLTEYTGAVDAAFKAVEKVTDSKMAEKAAKIYSLAAREASSRALSFQVLHTTTTNLTYAHYFHSQALNQIAMAPSVRFELINGDREVQQRAWRYIRREWEKAMETIDVANNKKELFKFYKRLITCKTEACKVKPISNFRTSHDVKFENGNIDATPVPGFEKEHMAHLDIFKSINNFDPTTFKKPSEMVSEHTKAAGRMWSAAGKIHSSAVKATRKAETAAETAKKAIAHYVTTAPMMCIPTIAQLKKL